MVRNNKKIRSNYSKSSYKNKNKLWISFQNYERQDWTIEENTHFWERIVKWKRRKKSYWEESLKSLSRIE
jgi:ABC-type transport system involved in cytochrome c biogenesis ATPase subunit